MKRVQFMGSKYCVCKSKKGEQFKYNPKYENVIRRTNFYIMGSENRTNEHDNWWELCVNGNAPLTDITPSKCVFYL